MTFNTRSLVDINSRKKFSNTLNTHDYDFLCLTETWLTCDITSAALFLSRYQIYRKDRMTNHDRKTKHGGVLIAIKNDILHEHISLQNEHSDCITIKIKTKKDSVILLCCIYNAPYPIVYQWESKDLKTLLENIQLKAKECQCNLIIRTGDLNLSQTNCLTMSSNLDYEKQLIDALVERNFNNQSTNQLDVVLANNPDSIVNCEYDKSLQNDLMQNDKSFSDHKPVVTTIDLEKEETQFAVTDIKYAFNKADWDELNKSIL